MKIKVSQILGLFSRIMRKFEDFFVKIHEESVEKSLPEFSTVEKVMLPIDVELEEELEETSKKLEKKKSNNPLVSYFLEEEGYAINDNDKDWESALKFVKGGNVPSSVSVKKKSTPKKDGNNNDENDGKKDASTPRTPRSGDKKRNQKKDKKSSSSSKNSSTKKRKFK